MHFSRRIALSCAFLLAIALSACGGSRGGCALYIPLGPVPAGTPIPTQPLPADSEISGNAFAGIDFSIDASGTVVLEHVRISSGSQVVDNAALQIVKSTSFKTTDVNCEGQPVRSGYIGIQFTP